MKKNKFLIISFLSGVLILASITSCNKDYYDINTNPNDPADVTAVELLPSAEIAIAHVVGNNFQIFGGLWGQYWTQSPSSSQYKTIEQYSPAANDFDRPWKALYADALKDLKTIVTKASGENKMNYVACAKILQAYTFQLLTDNFGDVPFSEALQSENDILSPKFDRQQDIYHGIANLLSEADALIDENAVFQPGAEDLLLGGDMHLWRKFGNTLKLRVYLRVIYADPAFADSGIVHLQGAEFLATGENVNINYTSTPGNSNPLSSSIVALSNTQNLVASATAINYLFDTNDPRIDAFYSPALNGSMAGLTQGDYTAPAGTLVSIPGPLTGGDGSVDNRAASALAPVRLMSDYESLFLQSEASARGLLGGDKAALYTEAIAANFADFGITDTSLINPYFADPLNMFPTTGVFEDELRAIITQKWIAMCGNSGTEGWTEWRRTGYPNFFTESVNSIIGGGRFPLRFFYPTTEVTRNANFPGQKLIYEPVWWDVH
jgi:hypothetical protein